MFVSIALSDIVLKSSITFFAFPLYMFCSCCKKWLLSTLSKYPDILRGLNQIPSFISIFQEKKDKVHLMQFGNVMACFFPLVSDNVRSVGGVAGQN